ncbi:DUF4007 family protein [Deinococcus arenicola]|uniref:DUF4007 family protein n=1 Tax=Deinococcus arenicola TaxID=2994950 RepID=A0ABU4DP59_9DEIO|nr:DUF4007 family protein [Deinococcus sp. ZS9-10]MDV6374158.1 DUF4007 family protein [Deinococcus sp. ZS9-10]
MLFPEVESPRGQFAGHETFPLRLLWLKKVYEAVGQGVESGYFQRPEAIAEFGVGKNMAVSMRFWALAAGMISEQNKRITRTSLADLILDNDGFDPYLEDRATTWLIHWHLASTTTMTTTIYFAFNHVNTTEFTAASLTQDIIEFAERSNWKISETTLKRDVEVFLRGYARKSETNIEDAAEPLMAELGLVKSVSPGQWFEFTRGSQQSLPDEVFLYGLMQFWDRTGQEIGTLTAEQISYAPGSPGRVFKLDEDSVVTRLINLESITKGKILWTDTAGLRQVQRNGEIDILEMLSGVYISKEKVV